MKLHIKLGLVTAALALALVPAAALANGPDYNPAPPEHPTAPPDHAKAYGKHCQGYSKQHVEGVPGTPFSACVKAMAQADHHPGLTGREACRQLSKKHTEGTQGTPFSRCIKKVAQMRKEEHEQEQTQQV